MIFRDDLSSEDRRKGEWEDGPNGKCSCSGYVVQYFNKIIGSACMHVNLTRKKGNKEQFFVYHDALR